MVPDRRDLRVRSTGVTLSVREHSPWLTGKQTVVLVHGYPDQQDTWDDLVAQLPLDDLHVVTYDVRGAGGSDVPAHREDYRTERLVDDLVAVLDALAPDGRPVHLVGHDWGSVQLWDAVSAESHDPRLAGRIASFTSISGPSLDHIAWLARHPQGRRRRLLRQLAHSWYVYAFQVPWLPDQLWSRAHRRMAIAMADREGLPRDHWGDELGANARNGLHLYRANLLHSARRTGPVRTDVPVLAVHPLRDHFLTDVVVDDLDVGCSDVTVAKLDAGHWVIRTHAERIAGLVSEHVAAHRA